MKYEITLKVMGKKFTASGDTVIDALTVLKPMGIAGTCILTVCYNGECKDRVLPTVMAKRAFQMQGASREAAIKNISLMYA